MIKRVLVLVVMGIVLSGCGVSLYEYTDVDKAEHINNARVIDVWATNNFDGEAEEALSAAVGEWNKVLNGQIVLRMGGEVSSIEVEEWEEKFEEAIKTRDTWLLIKVNSEHRVVRRYVDDGVLAFVPGLGAPIMFIIEDHMGNKNLKTVLMHEMGHMFGANHVNIEYTLMSPGYGPKQPDCVDELTARQVAWFKDLDFGHMNYCVVPK